MSSGLSRAREEDARRVSQAERDRLCELVGELEDGYDALRDRLALLDLIYRGDELVAYEWQIDTGRIVFSDDLKRLLGYEVAEHATWDIEDWRSLWHPDDAPQVLGEIADYRDGRAEVLDVEYRVRRQDGRWYWVRDRSRPERLDPDGRPARVRGALRDIDARKRAEAELRESEKKYRGVIENIQDVFYRSDASGCLLMGSPSGARLFGYDSVDDMIGLALDSFWPDPSQRERLLEIVRQNGSAHDFEAVFRRRDGSTFHASISTHFYYDDCGNRLGTEGIIRDITERKRAEERRLELERQLLHAQKLESLGVLAGGIAHDFNNLLMAIVGNLDLSLAHIPDDSAAQERIVQATRACRRAMDLTRQMLTYAGKGEFHVIPLDLNTLVGENADLFGSSIRRSATFTIHLNDAPCEIVGDPGQIQQVVMNLITNAAEALGECDGRVTLSTGVATCDDKTLSRSLVPEKAAPGPYAYVQVADTGCGMDEETVLRMFDPFFTTKFTGRGLGMAAVLGIVSRHEGAILVESMEDEGTTVRVLFPLRPAVAPRPSLARRPRPARRQDASAPTTVLVVDDEPAVRELCGEYVELLGHRVLSAADGEEALSVFRENSSDVSCVLLDLTMPRTDGVGVYEEMMRLQPNVTVVLCSGYDEHEARRRFASEGPIAFLQKPFLFEELAATLGDVMR